MLLRCSLRRPVSQRGDPDPVSGTSLSGPPLRGRPDPLRGRREAGKRRPRGQDRENSALLTDLCTLEVAAGGEDGYPHTRAGSAQWTGNCASKCTPPHVKSGRLSGDKTLYEHAPRVRESSRALERGGGRGCARGGRRAARRAQCLEALCASDPTPRPSSAWLRGAAGVRPPVRPDRDLRGLLPPGPYLRGNGGDACPPPRCGIVAALPGPWSRRNRRGRKWSEVLVQLPHTRWRDRLRLWRTAFWLHSRRSGAGGPPPQRCRAGPRSGRLLGGYLELPLCWRAEVPPALILAPRPRLPLEEH